MSFLLSAKSEAPSFNLARLYVASSFKGLSKITVFKFFSLTCFFCSLNIFERYRYDFSFFDYVLYLVQI